MAVQVPTYAPGPDAVFTACGETSAYPPREVIAEKTVAIAPAKSPLPSRRRRSSARRLSKNLRQHPHLSAATGTRGRAQTAAVPAQPPPASTAPTGWQRAHTIPKGRSNIRKAPNITSAVIAQLPPGVRILVQPSVDDWWHVTSPSGATFEGYIRHDRFTLD